MMPEIPIPILYEEKSTLPKDLIFDDERLAIHSGKLGDILYALPTIRALGINHLVLNVYSQGGDPLRPFFYKAARSLVSLLLQQPYLRKVSVSHCPTPLEYAWNNLRGIHYNLDAFRNVARHRVDSYGWDLDPRISQFSIEGHPVHLGQMVAASQGVQVDLSEPWLISEPSPKSSNQVVVSITRRWRSYPDGYWKMLLRGLPHFLFVGSQVEWDHCRFENGRYFPTATHLELASMIAGSRIFLGTISFPYAIAEGLKVKRMVELCHHNLNAFPVGCAAWVLPPDVLTAREMLADQLGEQAQEYRELTARLRKRAWVQCVRIRNMARISGGARMRNARERLGYVARKAFKKLLYFSALFHRRLSSSA